MGERVIKVVLPDTQVEEKNAVPLPARSLVREVAGA